MTTPEPIPPPEEPEAEGIPDPAADTSTAYDDADRPQFDDSPPALPAETPQAVDEYGVTAAEARRGEPLEDKLAREDPDVGNGPGRPAEALRDAEALAEERPRPEPGPVSAYDRSESGGPVGRLAEPDQQALVDTEKDEVARDEGEAGGGLSAEEAAMHEVDQDETP